MTHHSSYASYSTHYPALLQRIDASHASDPHLELDTATGQQQPKESLYAQRMANMLTRFSPEASEAVHISVRAQHIQRWMIPRSDFPMTTLGYKQWRARLYKYHADVTGELMHQVGYDDDAIAQVKAIVGKRGIKVNPEAQLLEDVASLVFLEHYLVNFVAAHPEYDAEKWQGILRKTWVKMSERGQSFALTKIHLPVHLRSLILSATQGDSPLRNDSDAG